MGGDAGGRPFPSDGPASSAAWRLSDPFQGASNGRENFPVPPPWSAILVRAESLGVWTMPDQRRLPEPIPTPRDGTSLWVESRARGAYRRFVYTAPYVRLGLRSEYDRADGLMRLVAGVMGLATRSEVGRPGH